MARQFEIPAFYRSPVISVLKTARRKQDRYKKDLSPTVLDLGPLRFKLARHFGFCYGVENAIEIAYRALAENPGRRVYLLSEMIHNPNVNADLERRGVRFLSNTIGETLIPFAELNADDVVIVPAFGATVEVIERLRAIGIDPQNYNTTCPFVEKVWNRSEMLGQQGYTVIIHGRPNHEETRATFSHARLSAPSLVIRDMAHTKQLAELIRGDRNLAEFEDLFRAGASPGFDPRSDLARIGVVNQTTMLASETQAIAEVLRQAMIDRYGEAEAKLRFADTRDTLCYATEENQTATLGLIEAGGDLAVVVGGYNSSNTSHLVELLEARYPAYYIKDAGEILSRERIRHLDMHRNELIETEGWMPQESPVEILLTAGASCPDAMVDDVLLRIASLSGAGDALERALQPFRDMIAADG